MDLQAPACDARNRYLAGLDAYGVRDRFQSRYQFAQQTGMPSGWGWALNLRYSDMLNLLGVALLATLSIAALIGILPVSLRKRDWLFAGLVAAQVVVLVAVALTGCAH